jgi:translation initiation factor 4G
MVKRFLRDIQDIWNNTRMDFKSTNSRNLLNDLVDLIYESALEEEDKFFRQIYAKLCNKMSSIFYTDTPDHKENTYFGDILMEKWKKELNSDICKEINDDSLLEECRDNLEMKLALQESDNLKFLNVKQRFFNSILFIGECYEFCFPNVAILDIYLPINDEFLNTCIEKLIIKETQEDHLECLCHFMMNIGEKYDKPSNATCMEMLFNKLNEIRRKDFIPLKLRALIVDVIKLRLNKWSKYSESKIESYEKRLCQLLLENPNEQNEVILNKIKV